MAALLTSPNLASAEDALAPPASGAAVLAAAPTVETPVSNAERPAPNRQETSRTTRSDASQASTPEDVQHLFPPPAEPLATLNIDTLNQEGAAPDQTTTASITPPASDTHGLTDAQIQSLIPAPDTQPTADLSSLISRESTAPALTQEQIEALVPLPESAADLDIASLIPREPPAVVVSAPEPAKPQAPIARITPEALQQAIEARRSHSTLPAKEFAAITAFYAARDNKPLWRMDDGWTPAAQAGLKRLSLAAQDGLKPAAYAATLPQSTDVAALASAEIGLSEAFTSYARDARGARVNPARISKLITATPTLPDTAQVLEAVFSAPDADAALRSYNPHHPGYLALREKLGQLEQAQPEPPTVIVPPGRLLKLGMADPRVPLLRARLALPKTDDLTFDEALSAAVSAFQKSANIAQTGTLNRATTLALSATSHQKASEADIIANMERWRWLPTEMGPRHVFVNVPEYMLRLVDNGTVIHAARVIVGKPDSQTPVFSNEMQFLVVNPSWYVPPSILKKEFLPGLAADPDYAAKRGFQVIRHGNSIGIRQPPGERNALGNIKFMFPNQHAVYIHDTPLRSLFANGTRAFSHGCVRVQDPFSLAEIVLGKDNGWSESHIRALVGRGERTIKLTQTLPVHLTYFTTWVDESGALQTRSDIYGHNRKVEAALGLL